MQQVGPYQLLEPISVSDLGSHFLAMRGEGFPALVVAAEDVTHRNRLVEEAQLWRSVHHPGFLPIQELGAEGSFLAHSWIPGRPLSQLLRKLAQLGRALDLHAAMFLAMRLIDTLQHLHQATDRPELVHRNICPELIWISWDGEVMLSGLYAAAPLGHHGNHQPTPSPYVAPEVLLEEPADLRSDMYGLGILLRTMLLGRPPYGGASPDEIRQRILEERLPPIGVSSPTLPSNIQQLIDATCARSPGERPPDLDALRNELARTLYGRDPCYGPRQLDELMRVRFAAEIESDRRSLAAAQTHGLSDHAGLAGLRSSRSSPAIFGLAELPLEHSVSSLAHLQQAEPGSQPLSVSFQPGSMDLSIDGSVSGSVSKPAIPLSQSALDLTPARRIPTLPLNIPPVSAPPPKRSRRGLLAAFFVIVLGAGLAIGLLGKGSLPQRLRDTLLGRKASATLELDSMPQGADVTLDGLSTGKKTPLTIENLESDRRHVIQLSLKGEIKEETLTLHAAERRHLTIEFRPSHRRLILNSEPSIAEVYLDGQSVALTPAKFSLKIGQDNTVEIKKVGYQVWKKVINPEPGAPMAIEAQLKKTETLTEVEATNDANAAIGSSIAKPGTPSRASTTAEKAESRPKSKAEAAREAREAREAKRAQRRKAAREAKQEAARKAKEAREAARAKRAEKRKAAREAREARKAKAVQKPKSERPRRRARQPAADEGTGEIAL